MAAQDALVLCCVLPEQTGCGKHGPPRLVLLRRVAQLVGRPQQDALQVIQVRRLPNHLQCREEGNFSTPCDGATYVPMLRTMSLYCATYGG